MINPQAICLAVESGNENLCLKLLSMGYTCFVRNEQGYTAGHMAASKGMKRIIEAAGADLLRVESTSQESLVHAAIEAGAAMVEWLVEKGAPVDKKSLMDQTELSIAFWSKKRDVVNSLIQLGAKADLIDGFQPGWLSAGSIPQNSCLWSVRMRHALRRSILISVLHL